MTIWHYYRVNAIDYGWEFLPSVEKVAKMLIDSTFAPNTFGFNPTLSSFVAAYNKILGEARKRGWEGDFRHNEANVFFLPDDTEFSYAFVWKQDNNGDTFVVSPYELPWLEKYGDKLTANS